MLRKKTLTFALWVNGLMIIAGPSLGSESDAHTSPVAGLELSAFVSGVLDTNHRLNAAAAVVDSRAALQRAADRPLYNPELFLEAENALEKSRAVGVSQSFDWANKRESRTEVAEFQRLAAKADYLAERWTLSMELLAGLARNQAARKQLELAEQRQDLMKDFVDLAQRRFDAGDLAQVELDLALLSLTDAQIRKANAASRLAEARQMVRNLVPVEASPAWPSLPLNFPAAPPRQADPRIQVERLPRIIVLQKSVEMSSAAVELRQRERRPDPTLSLAAGTEEDESLVALNLSIPLFIRNDFSNEVVAATADLAEAEQEYADAVQRAVSRYTGAYERYQFTREAWAGWEMGGQSSLARQTDLLQRLWEAGELSTTDYLVQLHQTLDVRENAMELWETLWLAWFEWLFASGELDTWLGASPS